MLLVTTVGRSGSSMIMEYCNALGMNCGKIKMIDAYDAGNEAGEVININNLLLKNLRDGISVYNKKVRKEIHDLDFDVIKDPKFLVAPEIIREWNTARVDLRVLLLTRDSTDIAKSCKRLPNMTGPNYRHYPAMIEAKEIDFIAEMKTLNIPYFIAEFPHFLDTPEVVEWIAEVCGSASMEIWNKTVNKTKVHIK